MAWGLTLGPPEEVGLRPGRGFRRSDARDCELEELAGVQVGQLLDVGLLDEDAGVEGPGGAVGVLWRSRGGRGRWSRGLPSAATGIMRTSWTPI